MAERLIEIPAMGSCTQAIKAKYCPVNFWGEYSQVFLIQTNDRLTLSMSSDMEQFPVVRDSYAPLNGNGLNPQYTSVHAQIL